MCACERPPHLVCFAHDQVFPGWTEAAEAAHETAAASAVAPAARSDEEAPVVARRIGGSSSSLGGGGERGGPAAAPSMVVVDALIRSLSTAVVDAHHLADSALSDDQLARLDDVLATAGRAAGAARARRIARAEVARELASEQQLCPVCLERTRDVAFGCGHRACGPCATRLTSCPECRRDIGGTRIKLF